MDGETPEPKGRAVSRQALRDQENLWADLLRLASAVQEMLGLAVRALSEGQASLAEDVKQRERAIDGWEVRIERECLRVLALYEPVASDFRRLGAMLKVNGDLERISNLSRNVAKRVRKLSADPQAFPISDAMAKLAAGVDTHVGRTLDALSRIDPTLARSVIDGDTEIDRVYHSVLDELKGEVRREPHRLDTWLREINAARDLERIADHAVNIAESVVYMSEGDIIRHPADAPSPT